MRWILTRHITIMYLLVHSAACGSTAGVPTVCGLAPWPAGDLTSVLRGTFSRRCARLRHVALPFDACTDTHVCCCTTAVALLECWQCASRMWNMLAFLGDIGDLVHLDLNAGRVEQPLLSE